MRGDYHIGYSIVRAHWGSDSGLGARPFRAYLSIPQRGGFEA